MRELGAETPVASGYEVEIRPPGEGIEQWSAVAETQTVVDERWTDEMRMEAIAHANGGDYDGWEAAAD